MVRAFGHHSRNLFSVSCGAKGLLLSKQVRKTTLIMKVIDKRNVWILFFQKQKENERVLNLAKLTDKAVVLN